MVKTIVNKLAYQLLQDKGSLQAFESELKAKNPDITWLAREFNNPEMYSSDECAQIVCSLACLPKDWGINRIFEKDHIDSAFAELTVLSGLSVKYNFEVEYEKETEKGKRPDLSIKSQPFVFELRQLDDWEPAKSREKIAELLKNQLAQHKIKAEVIIKPSSSFVFEPGELTTIVAELKKIVDGCLIELAKPDSDEYICETLDLAHTLPNKNFNKIDRPTGARKN